MILHSKYSLPEMQEKMVLAVMARPSVSREEMAQQVYGDRHKWHVLWEQNLKQLAVKVRKALAETKWTIKLTYQGNWVLLTKAEFEYARWPK